MKWLCGLALAWLLVGLLPRGSLRAEPAGGAARNAWSVDFHYAPEWWETAICLPDDWQKTLVAKEGELLYDYDEILLFNGWGAPTIDRFLTRLSFGLLESKPAWVRQELLAPRVPIVRTWKQGGPVEIVEDAFAVATPGTRQRRVDAVPRYDVLIVRMRNTAQLPVTLRPRVTLQTKFPVHAEAGGRQLTLGGGAGTTITATQGFEAAESAKGTWLLDFDAVTLSVGQEHALAFGVLRGPNAKPQPQDVAEAEQLRWRAEAYWRQLDLPYGHIEVPDPNIQALLDSSIRNIYQARQIGNGLPAFQVGPTNYRAMWTVDGSFITETIAMLGRTAEARGGLRYLLGFQGKDGGIDISGGHVKETGILLWALTRHARLTNDQAWLCEVWPNVERGVAYIQNLRRRAASDPKAPNYGLVPGGFGDGGAPGDAVYNNSQWNLVGMKAAAEAAEWLGKDEQARLWREEFEEFMARFRKAAERDARLDKHGNRVMPVSVRIDEKKHPPYVGQWAFEHAVFPGKLFTSDDPLVRSTMASLQANEREGMFCGSCDMCRPDLVHFIWTYEGSFYAHDWLWLGNGEKAARTLYAFANHASPLGVWREGQTPVDVTPAQYMGDVPHNWASAEFIRLVRHLLVLERDNELHLFEGLPTAWVKPGAVVRVHEVLTDFGPINLELRVARDAQTAHLHLEPPRRNPPEAIKVHLGDWATGPKGEMVLNLDLDKANDYSLPLKPRPKSER